MRVYNYSHTAVTLTGGAATTIFELTADINHSLVILRVRLAARTASHLNQDIQLLRRTSASTNVITPAANQVDGTVGTGLSGRRGLCTTLGTAGAILYPDSFDWLHGWLWLPKADEQIIVPGAGIFAVHCPTVPSTVTLNAVLTVWET